MNTLDHIRARYEMLVRNRIDAELEATAAIWDNFYDQLTALRRECTHVQGSSWIVGAHGKFYVKFFCQSCGLLDYRIAIGPHPRVRPRMLRRKYGR